MISKSSFVEKRTPIIRSWGRWLDRTGPDRPDWNGPDQSGGGARPERYPRSRGFPSRIKDQESWTLLWHEWASWKRYGRDIKTAQVYNRRPIILYRFRNTQDLGPCFGMNGHPRRDLDVILRHSKSTTDFLSFYIGFGSLSRVSMVVLDKNIGFAWTFIKRLNVLWCFILTRGCF